MSVSRRKFMKTGIVAAACAGIPLTSALGASSPAGWSALSLSHPGLKSLQSLGSIEQLGFYTRSTFAPHVNTTFRVRLDASNARELRLMAVRDLTHLVRTAGTSDSNGAECFTLLFATSQAKPFNQDTYLIEHEALGAFYMFLAPVGAPGNTNSGFYEAAFYRGPFPSPETANNGEQPEPARDPWRVSEERVIEGPGGERVVTVEREVYSFSSLAAGSAAAVASKKRKKGPSAAERALKLKTAQSPIVGGIKLGMTPEQVLALFPGSKMDADVRAELSRPVGRFGEATFSIQPAKYSAKAKFARITEITMTLLDGRVATVYVGYDSPMYTHVDEFVTKFSEGSSLPGVDYWEAYVGMDTQLKTLKAKNFEVNVYTGGENINFNYVQVIDVVAQQKLRDRTPELQRKG